MFLRVPSYLAPPAHTSFARLHFGHGQRVSPVNPYDRRPRPDSGQPPDQAVPTVGGGVILVPVPLRSSVSMTLDVIQVEWPPRDPVCSGGLPPYIPPVPCITHPGTGVVYGGRLPEQTGGRSGHSTCKGWMDARPRPFPPELHDVYEGVGDVFEYLIAIRALKQRPPKKEAPSSDISFRSGVFIRNQVCRPAGPENLITK